MFFVQYSSLTNYVIAIIIILVRQGRKPFTKGSEELENGMTNAELNSFLETLAKLVEATAKNPQEAAEIIRQAKTK